MSEPQVWTDMVRKYVRNEEEGRALLASPALVDVLKMTTQAVIDRQRADGYELTDVHHEPPQLVVNTWDLPVFAEYTHAIQMFTFALRRKVEVAA